MGSFLYAISDTKGNLDHGLAKFRSGLDIVAQIHIVLNDSMLGEIACISIIAPGLRKASRVKTEQTLAKHFNCAVRAVAC